MAIFFLFFGAGIPIPHANDLGLGAPTQVSMTDTHRLVLNGQGRRVYAWMVIYGIALYLPSRSGSLEYIMDEETPVMLRVEIVSKLMPKDMPEGLVDSVRSVLGVPLFHHLRARYGLLTSGDIVLVGYDRDKGTTIAINGEEILSHPGRRLMDVFLEYWVGGRAVSDTLRADLLGATEVGER